MKAVEESLKHLRPSTSIYYRPAGRTMTYPGRNLRALDDLVKAGKVRYLGCSNEPAWRLTKAFWISEQTATQSALSAHSHRTASVHGGTNFEREHEAVCLDRASGSFLTARCKGLVDGKYRREAVADGDAAEGLKILHREEFPAHGSVRRRGKAHNASVVTQMALAWLLLQRPR